MTSRAPNLPFVTPAGQSIHEVMNPPRSMIEVESSTPSVSKFSSADTTSIEEVPQPLQRKFKSARLVGDYEKPWMQERPYRKRERVDKAILGVCALVGFIIAGLLCWNEWKKLPVHDYCMILDDNFETINQDTWSHEVGVGGFGYQSFDWTTDDPKNSYTSSEGLHIVPTLTTETTDITPAQILNGYVLNLTTDGTCTSPVDIQCSRVSNSTNSTIINPVRSARLTTAQKKSIKYGRVEIIAKMPKGDWLWPSIWMYPENETYGPWPASGEIDIAQIRGNSYQTYSGGRDTVTSAMHWGPLPNLDQSARTTGKLTLRREDLAANFHTYGLEWSATHFFTWIDSRTHRTLTTGFGKSWGGNMYQRAGFPALWVSGQLPPNVWSATGLYNTPFDQPYHLILNVAVGSNNGFFPDSKGGKPWLDGKGSAMSDFWNDSATWLPTWGEGDQRGMTVKSVRMWQQGKCGT